VIDRPFGLRLNEGEPMRLLHSCRYFVLALAVAALAGGAAKADEHKHDAKPAVFVKEGDKFRPATEAEVKAAVADDHGHGKKGGELDFTGIKRYDLGIYTLLVFGILMFVLAKFAWPKIREGLDKREVNIRSALDQAKQGQADAVALIASAKKQLDDGALQVKAMLDEARRDADAVRAAEREAAAKDIAAAKDRAKREIAAEKDAILKDVYEQSVKLAALMSEKALRRTVSAEDHRRLLDESIAEIRSANKA
jgi:F-type H+-transporting ATPase subunit b